MADEKVIRSETIYQGKLFDVKVDTVEVEGRSLRREIVVHRGAVAIVPIDADGKVIMVRQYRSGSHQSHLELPAGGLDTGEAPEDAARRELQEEIGQYPDELIRLGGYWVAAAYNTEYITIYLCRVMHASQLRADSDEYIDIERMPYAEALARAQAGGFDDAKTAIGLMWADAYMKQPG